MPRPGPGPAWAVVSLVTIIMLFYTLTPAGAAEPRLVRLNSQGPDMIDAPMVVVNAKAIWVDGTEVAPSALQARLEAVSAQHATFYPGRPRDSVVVYMMSPDTPAALVRRVDAACRAAGYTKPSFMLCVRGACGD